MLRARLLVAALIALASAAVACRPSGDPNGRDFERMRRQRRYDAYGGSRIFPNGAVMQSPPAHTIARNAAVAAAGEVAPPGFATGLENGVAIAAPLSAPDPRTRALGAEQFAVSCALCHGAGGFGGGPMAVNMPGRRPPSLRDPRIRALPAGTLFRVITYGFGYMPPLGWQMPAETRWAVVRYVQSLSGIPPTDETRADSLHAATLNTLDSLRRAKASLETILRARRRLP